MSEFYDKRIARSLRHDRIVCAIGRRAQRHRTGPKKLKIVATAICMACVLLFSLPGQASTSPRILMVSGAATIMIPVTIHAIPAAVFDEVSWRYAIPFMGPILGVREVITADPCKPTIARGVPDDDGSRFSCRFGKGLIVAHFGLNFSLQTVGAVVAGVGLRRHLGNTDSSSSNTIQQPSLPGGVSISANPDGLRIAVGGSW